MKARIKFSKTGTMRFIGHLDVMRYFQRAFRRAGVKASLSKGFSPHPVMSFASPLGVGLSSDAEYLDVALDKADEPRVMIEKINAQLNDEIVVRDFTFLSDDAAPSMSALAACDYLAALKPGKGSALSDDAFLSGKLKGFLSLDKIEIEKNTKSVKRRVDIRDNIYYAAGSVAEFEEMTGREYKNICVGDGCRPLLFCRLTAGSVVNVRPELVLKALCDYSGIGYNEFDFQIHRLDMYADLDAPKGEVHTLKSPTPCRLVPLSEYEAVR